jgi:hypothetical protein
MKKRLNITIEENLLNEVKQYAIEQDISISNLVETHFEEILKPKTKTKSNLGLIEFLKTLPKSKTEFPEDFDWKETYFKSKLT